METYKYKNVLESGVIKTSAGRLRKLVINSHSSGTVQFYDGNEGGAAATSVLTSAGALVAATHAVTELVSSGAMVAGTHAVSVLTGDAIVAGNEVVIDDITYTFVNALTSPATPYEVLVGATDTISLANLVKAVNATAGGVGTAYSQGTVAHASVVAVTSDATTMTVRGRVPGTSLNALATTGTALRTVWADTTLGGGTGASDAGVTTAGAQFTLGDITYTIVDELSENYGAAAVAYQIKKGANEAAMLDNIKLAVNATGTAGTNYSTGTLVHPTVVATTNTDTVQTFRGRVPGTSLNTVVTTEAMANTAFADTTLGGGTGNSNPGVTTAGAQFAIDGRTYTVVIELSESLGAAAIADQILWVTSEAVFLDNVKKAINASGIAGTDYSTGTTEHATVFATTNTNTEQTIVAKKVGTGGNAITTTEALANYSWTSTVMAGGTGTDGRKIGGTITFSAVATTGEREIDFGQLSFDTSLYAVVGGTVDLTVVYD